MLAGEDGPGGISFNDFNASYLIGSIALAIILFEGGLKPICLIPAALWPSLALATVGVALTAGLVGRLPFGVLSFLDPSAPDRGGPRSYGWAAVNTLLRAARVAVPERVKAVLELESGGAPGCGAHLLDYPSCAAGVRNGDALFGAVFGVVIASLVLQGWTMRPRPMCWDSVSALRALPHQPLLASLVRSPPFGLVETNRAQLPCVEESLNDLQLL